jgi:hypothetical protein
MTRLPPESRAKARIHRTQSLGDAAVFRRTNLFSKNIGPSGATAALVICLFSGSLFSSGSLAGVLGRDLGEIHNADCGAPGASCAPPVGRHKSRPEGEAMDTASQRQVLQCARKFAWAAYKGTATEVANEIGNDCSGGLNLQINGDVLKLWTRQTIRTELVIISNRGTTFDQLGDAYRDAQNIGVAVDHFNALNTAIEPRLGSVGRGWSERWTAQAAAVRAQIDQARTRARANARTLEVQVMGHSLGAAVATVAGYDIAHYLRNVNRNAVESLNVPYDVIVYSFNPPKIFGRGAFNNGDPGRPRYVAALLGSVERASGDNLSLTLRQFTRDWDAVQSVPPVEVHPVWSRTAGSTIIDAWTTNGATFRANLGYCPQLNVRHRVRPDPTFANHLADWAQDIAEASDSQIACMFRRRTPGEVARLAVENTGRQNGLDVDTGGRPSLATFRGSSFMAYQEAVAATTGGSRIMVMHQFGINLGWDVRWSEPAAIEGAITTHPPAMVRFGRNLLVFWRGLEGRIYWSSSADGLVWGAPVSTGVSSREAPAVAVVGNTLYMALQGAGTDSSLWLAASNGAGFPPAMWTNQQIRVDNSPVIAGSAPSLALGRPAGAFYIAYRAGDSSNALRFLYNQGSGWRVASLPGISIQGAPSLDESFDNELLVAFRRPGDNSIHFAKQPGSPGSPSFTAPWDSWNAPGAQASASPALLGRKHDYYLAFFREAGTSRIRFSQGRIEPGPARAQVTRDLRREAFRTCSRSFPLRGFASRRQLTESNACQCGVLTQGQLIVAGQTIFSCDYTSVLKLRVDGVLEFFAVVEDIYGGTRYRSLATWGVTNNRVTQAMINDDGQLLLSGRQGVPDQVFGSVVDSTVALYVLGNRVELREMSNNRVVWRMPANTAVN